MVQNDCTLNQLYQSSEDFNKLQDAQHATMFPRLVGPPFAFATM
jgi:hypothetical protein